MHPFPSSCCCPTLMEVAAVSLYCGTGELFQRAPERGAGAVSPSMPPFKKSSSLPSFLGPMSQKQRGSVQRCSAVLCAGHSGAQGWCGKQGCSVGTKDQLHEEQGCSRALPLLTACQQWCSGGLCCRTVWVRGLKWCVLVSLLSAWHWGSTGHSVGFPVWRVFVPVQCPPLGTPCALCFQAASAWPQQQRNLLRLRGCEPGLGLPPDPTFLLLACCGRHQPLRAQVGLLPWGCHQGWVTRRGPRGKEGTLPALPGGCWTLGLGQPLAGSLGTALLSGVISVHGVPSWSWGGSSQGSAPAGGAEPPWDVKLGEDSRAAMG